MDYQKITSQSMGGANALRRALELAYQKKAPTQVGVQLNRSTLARTITYAKMGQVNKDRYQRQFQKPEVKASWSFAIDGSASMGWRDNLNQPTPWQEVLGVINALHLASQRMGITSSSALVHFQGDYDNEAPEGSSTSTKPIASIIKSPSDHWDSSLLPRLEGVNMKGGTSLTAYAETAIDMVQTREADWKIAFFLTDGDSSDKVYLESLRLQALTKGIILIGIGLGVKGTGLPNGCSAKTASQLAPLMLHHIAQVVSKGTHTTEA